VKLKFSKQQAIETRWREGASLSSIQLSLFPEETVPGAVACPVVVLVELTLPW
jgi:hypothetical protein